MDDPAQDVSCSDKRPPGYSALTPRLNRIGGQIEGVKRMIGARAYCPDILTQLRAIRASINSLEATILEQHLDSCVTAAFEAGSRVERAQKIEELKQLYRRFND